MKRKQTVICLIMFVVVLGALGGVPGVISFASNQQYQGQAEAIVKNAGGKITQRYESVNTVFAKVPEGKEDKVVSELLKLPGVSSERSTYKCPA